MVIKLKEKLVTHKLNYEDWEMAAADIRTSKIVWLFSILTQEASEATWMSNFSIRDVVLLGSARLN